MADLISRSALYQSFRESATECYEWTKEMAELGDEVMHARVQQAHATFVEACLRVKDAPEVDAVEVVRCGKCKLWSEAPNSKYIREYHRCRFSECLTRENDYCSKGERREDVSGG